LGQLAIEPVVLNTAPKGMELSVEDTPLCLEGVQGRCYGPCQVFGLALPAHDEGQGPTHYRVDSTPQNDTFNWQPVHADVHIVCNYCMERLLSNDPISFFSVIHDANTNLLWQ
jgi:hypothetical protein